jgi:hypothetical protein
LLERRLRGDARGLSARHHDFGADGHALEQVGDVVVEHADAAIRGERADRVGPVRMLERLNEEIRRRTYVVRIFPNSASCCPLVRALAVETHENGLEVHAPSTGTT